MWRGLGVIAQVALLPSVASAEIDFEIELRDAEGYGFLDASPTLPVGGNVAPTLGEQRQAALEAAMAVWSSTLDGATPVRVAVSFLPTVDCDVAAGAEPERYVSGEPGLDSQLAYPVALAERVLERELNGGDADIELFFNEQFCDGQPRWYLGLDAKPALEEIDLVTIALHELAHGLGLTTKVSVYDGHSGDGKLDAFASLIYDTSVSKAWSELSASAIADSVLRQRTLAWGGQATRRYVVEHFDRGLPYLTVSPAIDGITGLLSETNVGPRAARDETARLRLAGDGAACEPLANNGVASVLLALEGGCQLRQKAEIALAAGAVALLIASNAATSPPAPLVVTGEEPLALPVFGVTRDDAQRLEASVGLTLGIAVDAARRVGADADGRAMLFVGMPPVAGVNLVHWDTLARAGGLLRPVIGPGVALRDVGLEAAALRDLGWVTVCGNARLDAGEECDPEDDSDRASSCRSDCSRPRCGDSIVDVGEVCDRGKLAVNCTSDCQAVEQDAAPPVDGGVTPASPTAAVHDAAVRLTEADAGAQSVDSILQTASGADASVGITRKDGDAASSPGQWTSRAAATNGAVARSGAGGCRCSLTAREPSSQAHWSAAAVWALAIVFRGRRKFGGRSLVGLSIF